MASSEQTREILAALGFSPWKWTALFINLPGMIAITNSIIGSVLIIGILMDQFAMLTRCTILLGSVIFIIVFIAHKGYQMIRLKKAEKETGICFPSAQTHK